MDEQGDQLLSLSAEQIYDQASNEVQPEWTEHDQPTIQENHFKIQVFFQRNTRPILPKVLILAITTRKNTLPSHNAPSTTNIQGKNKRPKTDVICPNEAPAESKKKTNVLKLQEKMSHRLRPNYNKDSRGSSILLWLLLYMKRRLVEGTTKSTMICHFWIPYHRTTVFIAATQSPSRNLRSCL